MKLFMTCVYSTCTAIVCIAAVIAGVLLSNHMCWLDVAVGAMLGGIASYAGYCGVRAVQADRTRRAMDAAFEAAPKGWDHV